MKWFKSKPTYSQEDVVKQQEIVAEAFQQRTHLEKTGTKDDLKRADTSVEVAQEILNFMLEENVHKWEK